MQTNRKILGVEDELGAIPIERVSFLFINKEP